MIIHDFMIDVNIVIGIGFPTQLWQRPVTTCVYIYIRGCKYSLELLMMSGVPLETCWAFNKFWNNKFYYKVASCWLFLLISTGLYHIHSQHQEPLTQYQQFHESEATNHHSLC